MKKVLLLPISFIVLFILISNAYSYVSIVTVRPGATLSRIAYIHNTTVRSIMSLNGLRNYRIYPGERLRVPLTGHSGYYRREIYYGRYTVRFGDTLSLIAHKYGTSVAELRRLNHLYSNVVRQGAVIRVPERNAHRVYSPTVAYITVRPGYTLSQIAFRYGSSVSSIMSLNDLHNYNIYPGQKLKVVSGVSRYGRYTVRFGDTLSLIAHKYGTSVAELRRLNHLHSNMIKQGAVIRVPERNAHRVYSPTVAYITVRPGATLSRIAYIHNTTVRSIMSLNGLRNYRIYPGERLRVPLTGHSGYYRREIYYGRYTVRFGDTLSLIAHKYGTSVAELRRLNHLHSNMIKQGAVIRVPERNKTYRVAGNNQSYVGIRSERFGTKNNFILGEKIVRVAYRYLGVPYVWGGTSQYNGMDCSGLTQKVFSKLGIRIPRTAAEQARLGKYVPKNRLKPGDLLFFRTYAPYISHVGIYIGHDKFIQENYGAGKATITDLSNAYFERTYAFAKVIR